MKPGDKPEESLFDEQADVASAAECTGLVPALPPTEAEEARLRELYAVRPARSARRRCRTR